MEANRQYKDGIFRIIFNEPKKALELYNAITGKNLSIETPVEITNVKTVLLSRLRNDLAFIICGRLIVLIEHQASLNLNIPLRMLQYILIIYEIFCDLGKALYKKKQIKLPKPEFYMLYNGTEPCPANTTLRLSDAFNNSEQNETPPLELIVKVININYGENKALLEKSKDLEGYALFVAKTRKYQNEGANLSEALKKAADECLAEGFLSEFLTKYSKELVNLFNLYYDENMAIEIAKEEAWEDGLEKGVKKGIKKGVKKGESNLIKRMLKKGKSPESIAFDTDIPIEQIAKISERLKSVV